MAEELPQEALVRVFHGLPIRDRSRLACVSRAWQSAALVDAVSVKLKDHHDVPAYLHVALPDGAAQLQAAGCPIMSLARSADVIWASAAATGSLLQSMPSLERLAFTSMASGALAAGEPSGGGLHSSSGLHSLKSLTNLQSLQLNAWDAAPLLEAVPSAPATLKDLELHLSGDNWQSSVLDKVATQLGQQASQLCCLVLRCSHASVYAATEPMESLSRLTSLTSLRMGPNPEDVCQHSSPLGFPRLPAFLAGLGRLQCLDISMADAPSAAPLSSVCFEPLRAIPDVKLTLRADTSLRSVAHLPPSLSAVTGLSSLTVQGFTFEDPGGWCTHALFDLAPVTGCRRLRELDLTLGNWECEHCEALEVLSLQQLRQLRCLRVCIAAVSGGQPQAAASTNSGGGATAAAGMRSGSGSSLSSWGSWGGRGSAGGAAATAAAAAAAAAAVVASGPVQEVLVSLPLMRPALEVVLVSSMPLVLRNSKVLARAQAPGVLAHSISLEEPRPSRAATKTDADAPLTAAGAAGAGGRGRGEGGGADAGSPVRDQSLSPRGSGGRHAQHVQQYVRAPAHVVISALRDLWPAMEVWQYPTELRGSAVWQRHTPELCCRADKRDAMQQRLQGMLQAALSGP